MLALSIFGLFPRRRRKLLPLLAALVLFPLPLTLSGCGGGGGTSTNAAASTLPAQRYTVTLIAKDSVQTSITASTTFVLSVQ